MPSAEKIYLDYAASTPVDDRVLQAMLPYFSQVYGNPSSVHAFGQQSELAVDRSRASMAQRLNASEDEVIFTSCGTESDNLALRGVAWMQRKRHGSRHILTTPVEHHAVLHTVQLLAEQGFEVEFLPVDRFGLVEPGDVEAALRPDTAIVSVIYANNEIGTINPIAEIGAICRAMNIPFHTDAVQAASHLQMDVVRDQVDLLSLGAHKFYGPKGVGALYIRRGTPIEAAQTGGKQEFGLRAGTHNVPYIVGMAKAFELAQEEVDQRAINNCRMREQLVGKILSTVPASQITGHPEIRLPNHASFVFEGIDGNQLLMQLDVAGFACSSGSACKTGSPSPSEVLTAIGLDPEWALGSLRVTFGHDTNRDVVDRFADQVILAVEQQRRMGR